MTLLSDQPEHSGYNPLHWAQATCYAFILAQQRQLPEVRVRLIYCQLETEETISFTHRLSFEQLSQFYLDLLARYHRWAMMRFDWEQLRNRCAKQLAFPFSEYRAGQRQMAAVIYRAAENGSRILCQAPTGIGKTISSLFPSIKALGEGKLSHIFISDRKKFHPSGSRRSLCADAGKRTAAAQGEPDRQGPHLLSARAAVQPRRLSLCQRLLRPGAGRAV